MIEKVQRGHVSGERLDTWEALVGYYAVVRHLEGQTRFSSFDVARFFINHAVLAKKKLGL